MGSHEFLSTEWIKEFNGDPKEGEESFDNSGWLQLRFVDLTPEFRNGGYAYLQITPGWRCFVHLSGPENVPILNLGLERFREWAGLPVRQVFDLDRVLQGARSGKTSIEGEIDTFINFLYRNYGRLMTSDASIPDWPAFTREPVISPA